MEIKLDATIIFEKNHSEYEKGTRLVVNQGGSRSSKTVSLAQLFFLILAKENNVLLTVCRKTLPALKATAMRDFFDILKQQGIYREENHNKTELTYKYKNNEIEFISVDQPQKVRGRKRQYLWMNETNEFELEDFRQLAMRTERQIFMDFNPSDEFHWIYEHVLTRPDSVLIKSTYKDNPFLSEEIIKEIELFQTLDQNYWRIYGLGERGVSATTIYSHWQLCDDSPEYYDDKIYGLDFGYNNPTALIEIVLKDKACYWREKLYKSHLTNSQLIDELKKICSPASYIYADCAEPQRIKEIGQAGFNVKPADKDVKKGIDMIKSRGFFITKDSINLLKEIKSYHWKEKDGKPLDEPIKINDHCLDAGRYAIHTYYKDLADQPPKKRMTHTNQSGGIRPIYINFPG